jgi:hypothetical protein
LSSFMCLHRWSQKIQSESCNNVSYSNICWFSEKQTSSSQMGCMCCEFNFFLRIF